MKFLRRHAPVIILQLCTYGILFIALGGFIFEANSRLFNPGGDGIKNYFTFAYQLKHGKGWWFDGMSYPYGEHLLFTDSFAAYAWLLNFIDNHIITLHPYSVGIINLTVLLSFGLCSWLLYKILRHYKLANWYAVPAALCICFLSPQIMRLEFHYSLAFSLYVPMLWYFLLKFLSTSKLKWSLFIIVGICFFGLLHPYYLPLGSFFVLAFAAIYALQNIQQLKSHSRTLILLFATALLPIILLGIFTGMTDPVTDRHIAPYGLWVYKSQFESVFFPSFGPIRHWWAFAKLPGVEMEGMAYVGFWGLLVLVIIGIRTIWRLLNRQFKTALQFSEAKTLNAFLWGAILLLILSFALPFIWFGFLLDWIPQLRQFRSLGRFAWAFYYVYSVFVAYYFYQIIQACRQKAEQHNGSGINFCKIASIALPVIILGFWLFEGIINIHTTAQIMYGHKNENYIFKDNDDYIQYLTAAGRKVEDFQAILPVPYFNNGSEKWYLYRDGRAAAQAYKCAFETGLSIAALHSPRSSISQAARMTQLFSSDCIEKNLLKDIGDKPFLLLVFNNSNKKPDEQQLINKANQLYKNEKITLYELPLSAFETRFEKIKKNYLTQQDSLQKGIDFLTNTAPANIILKRFDDGKASPFAGNGAAHSGDSIRITLHDGILNEPGVYQVSVWTPGDNYRPGFPKLFHYQYNQKGEQVGLDVISPKFETEIYGDGEWVMAKIVFRYQSPGNRVHLYLESEDLKTTGIVADEFMVRPLAADVYYGEMEEQVMYNTYKIPK